MGVSTTEQIATKSINPPCGLSYAQGKGLGKNTGNEVTTTTGHEYSSSLATRPIAL